MRKAAIGFLLIGVLACGLNSEIERKYYANLVGVVSPYLEYTPQGEITRKQADSLGRYYIFSYKNNKLYQIRFFKRNRPSDQSYFRTHSVRYEYKKNSVRRSYYDKDENRTTMWRHYYGGGDIHEEKYTLDKFGKKNSLVLKDTSGNQISNGEGVYRYNWVHLSDTRIIQTHVDSLGQLSYYRKDIPFKRLILEINDLGYSRSLTRINADKIPENHPSEGYAKLELLFDNFGNETGWVHKDKDSKLVNLPNEFGHSKWLYKKQYSNQKWGIVRSFMENYYDKDGLRVQNDDGIHQVQYVFNKYGDISEMKYYNANLERQMHRTNGFFRAEVQYDSIGNRRSVLKYDVSGKLLE